MLHAQIGHELLLALANAKDRKDVAADDVQTWVRNAAKMFHNGGNLAAAARCGSSLTTNLAFDPIACIVGMQRPNHP